MTWTLLGGWCGVLPGSLNVEPRGLSHGMGELGAVIGPVVALVVISCPENSIHPTN